MDAASRPEPYVIAPMRRRFGAWLLDAVGLVVAVSVIALALNMGETFNSTFVRPDGTTVSQTGHFIGPQVTESFLALLSLFYCTLTWRYLGGTLAQRALGLRVLDASGPKHLGSFRAGIRWLVLFGWTFAGVGSAYADVFTLIAIGWFLALLISTQRSEQKQGIHDRIARSLVVARPDPWSRRRQWAPPPRPIAPGQAIPWTEPPDSP